MFSKSYGTISLSKNGGPTFLLENEGSLCGKKMVAFDARKMLFLLNTISVIDYHVRLLHILLSLHWNRPTLISWENCWVEIFHYFMTRGFWKMDPYDLVNSIDCLFIENTWQEADLLLLSLKNIPWISLGQSIPPLTSLKLFVLITLAYPKQEAFSFRCVSFNFPGCATEFILSFWTLAASFCTLSIFHFFFISFNFFLKLYRNEHPWH